MEQYKNIYDFEVTPEEEHALRNLPKLPAVCQFMSLFKHVLKVGGNESLHSGTSKERTIGPHDLE